MKDGSHIVYKQTGRPDAQKIWSLVKDAVVCIGHSRLVTSGANDIFNAQPIVTNDLAVVHNGIAEGNILEQDLKGFVPATQNDSELLVPLLRQGQKINFAHALLCVKFDLYDWNLEMSSLGLPLESKQEASVTYYCSKKW
ncbi:MAG: class II glutamine amidotransferase [Methylophilaceae bacterium]